MSAGPADVDDVLERARRRLFAGDAPKDPTLSSDAPHAGVRRGPYEILEKIGEGAMGVVWRARDPVLDRTLALKVVRTASPATHARLLAEGRALARVSHPNVVQIFDVEEQDGQVVLAMEYVQGRTLREWTRDRAWPAIVEVLAQAGRGLAATHARGIAHRDFKPDNVLVDDDGRARVVDFGLARDVERSVAAAQQIVTLGGEPSERTRTGTLLGTPAYMSPEQFQGHRGDARSDQYSFCVTAYEALCGERPFTGLGGELRDNVLAGRRAPLPAATTAPARILKVLDRGLSLDPAARWPDMPALLAALERAPPRRRGWYLGAALALAIAGGLFAWTEARAQMCAGAHHRLVGVWDLERRAALEQAILATHAPFARDSATAVVHTLDAYAQRWALAHADACAATHLRGEQSEARLDARMRCLSTRLAELDATAQVIAETDATSVHAVLQAAQRLPPVDACALQDAGAQPPSSPAAQQPRARLMQVRALRNAGRPRVAYALAEEVARATAGLADERLTAEATYQLGLLAAENEDIERGEALLRRGYLAAERLGMPELARDAAWSLGTTVGHVRERVEEGTVWADIAEAKAILLADAVALGRVLMLRANLASTRGDVAEALRFDLAATEQLIRGLGPDHIDVARSRTNLGISQRANGDRAAALATLQQALEGLERAHGSQHPAVATAHNELGKLAGEAEDYDEAVRRFTLALEIWSRAYKSNHRDVALALKNLGVAENRRGHTEQALRHLQRALAIREAELGPDHSETLSTVQALANVAFKQGELERARAGFHRVLATQERSQGPEHATVVSPLLGLAGCARQDGSPQQALALAQRASAIDLRGPATAHTGTLALLLGDLLEAPAPALAIYERDAQRITAVFGPEHPDVTALRARIDTLRSGGAD